MGDYVPVYGVLLVGVSLRDVVWLMLCFFNQAHAPSPEEKKQIQQERK